jgi:hypothetical protein
MESALESLAARRCRNFPEPRLFDSKFLVSAEWRHSSLESFTNAVPLRPARSVYGSTLTKRLDTQAR